MQLARFILGSASAIAVLTAILQAVRPVNGRRTAAFGALMLGVTPALLVIGLGLAPPTPHFGMGSAAVGVFYWCVVGIWRRRLPRTTSRVIAVAGATFIGAGALIAQFGNVMAIIVLAIYIGTIIAWAVAAWIHATRWA